MVFMGTERVNADSGNQPVPPATPACSAPEFRQFDFWLGDWEVRDPTGKKVGENRITAILGGCALLENWSGTGGVNGTSVNIYDAQDHQWHQAWVDRTGGFLQLAGEFKNGKMILTGQTPVPDRPGQATLQRITWEAQRDGRVRQLWESSPDGKLWGVAFDGLYARK